MKKLFFPLIPITLALSMCTSASAALVVAPGFDLFQTVPPTNFNGVDFEGVQLGTFDFGTGPRDVGNASTIVQRLEEAMVASASDAVTIPIVMVALQLRSVSPVDFGQGTDFHFITLQSNRSAAEGGPGDSSTGEMTIQFDSEAGGIFHSEVEVAFDVRIGSLTGDIIENLSDVLPLEANNVPWDRIAPPRAVLINGVNHLLSAEQDNTEDFWPGGGQSFTEIHRDLLAQHSVRPAEDGPEVIPEPASLLVWSLLLGSAVIGVGWRRRRVARGNASA